MELDAVRLLPDGFRIFECPVDVGVSELVAGVLKLISQIRFRGSAVDGIVAYNQLPAWPLSHLTAKRGLAYSEGMERRKLAEALGLSFDLQFCFRFRLRLILFLGGFVS